MSQAIAAVTLLRTHGGSARRHAIDALRTIALLVLATLAILVLLPAALAAQVAFPG